MVDESDQIENTAESAPGGENPPEPEEPQETPEPESLLAQKTEELAKANARLEELEEAIAGKDGEIAGLKQDRNELEDRLASLNSSFNEAVASYKMMMVRANPEVIEDLISGDTIESVNESLDRAKALVSRVRQGVEAEISLAKVPAGAPERKPPDLSALSPREKIQYAIGNLSS